MTRINGRKHAWLGERKRDSSRKERQGRKRALARAIRRQPINTEV